MFADCSNTVRKVPYHDQSEGCKQKHLSLTFPTSRSAQFTSSQTLKYYTENMVQHILVCHLRAQSNWWLQTWDISCSKRMPHGGSWIVIHTQHTCSGGSMSSFLLWLGKNIYLPITRFKSASQTRLAPTWHVPRILANPYLLLNLTSSTLIIWVAQKMLLWETVNLGKPISVLSIHIHSVSVMCGLNI